MQAECRAPGKTNLIHVVVFPADGRRLQPHRDIPVRQLHPRLHHLPGGAAPLHTNHSDGPNAHAGVNNAKKIMLKCPNRIFPICLGDGGSRLRRRSGHGVVLREGAEGSAGRRVPQGY